MNRTDRHTEAGASVARPVTLDALAVRDFGQLEYVVPASFFESLTGEELAAWE